MAGDEGTLATTAEVHLAIGQNASAEQILEANTNTWIKWAEGDISNILGKDIITNYSNITSLGQRFLSGMASARAAFYAIQQNQNTWGLSTTQSKLNVIDDVWQEARAILKDKDKRAFLGLS